MKYTVETSDHEDFTFRAYPDDKSATITIDQGAEYWFTFDEFKALRKAVGYVWQEIEGSNA